MSFSYTYSISADFSPSINDGKISIGQLAAEINISVIAIPVSRIDLEDDTIKIFFDQELSSPQHNSLSEIVLAHRPIKVEIAGYQISKVIEENPNVLTDARFFMFSIYLQPSDIVDVTVKKTIEFKYNIGLIETEYVTLDCHLGDFIELIVGEYANGSSTPVGYLTAGCSNATTTWTSQNYTEGAIVTYTPNATHGPSVYECILDTTSNQVPTNSTYWKEGYKINVSSTVLDDKQADIGIGYTLSLTNGATLDELGEVIHYDKANNWVYMEKAPTHSYGQGSYIMAKYSVFKDLVLSARGRCNVGRGKIGSSGLKKGIPVTVKYTTKVAGTKSLFIGNGQGLR